MMFVLIRQNETLMTRTIFIVISLFLLGCADDKQQPVQLVDKKVSIEFFTEKDFSDSKYENHFVKFWAGALVMTYDPYEEAYFLSEETDWIAFKDIPDKANALVFEGVSQGIDVEKQLVQMGYSYLIKIGNHTESLSKSFTMQKHELEKTLEIKF
jgi:hypothetical protein